MNDCYWCKDNIRHSKVTFTAPREGLYLSIECLEE